MELEEQAGNLSVGRRKFQSVIEPSWTWGSTELKKVRGLLVNKGANKWGIKEVIGREQAKGKGSQDLRSGFRGGAFREDHCMTEWEWRIKLMELEVKNVSGEV